MGCSSSQIYPGVDSLLRDLYLIRLSSRDISRLIQCFKQIDINGNGFIDLGELYSYYNMDETPYMYHIFHQVERNHPREINVREFILCLWYFLTRNHDAIIGILS